MRARQRRDRRPTPGCSAVGRRGHRRRRGRGRAPSTSTWSWSVPRRRSWRGSPTRSATPGSAASARPAAAARLEGSKAFCKEVMEAAGVPTAAYTGRDRHPQAGMDARSSGYPAVIKADGLAAGKGVIIAADEEQARDALDQLLVERQVRHRAGGRRGVPRRRGAVAAGALRRRERACRSPPPRTTSGSSTATRGPNTGGMGSYSPVPAVDDARGPGDLRRGPPAGARRARAAGDPVPGRALRRADDDRGRPPGARVQRPLRRSRDAGDPAAAALRPARRCSRPRPSPGRPARRRSSSGRRRWRSRVVLASAGYPASSSQRRRDHGPRRRRAPDVATSRTPAPRATRDGQIVTAGGRVLSVTALGADVAVGARGRICCRRHDRVRRQAAAPRHRAPAWRADRVA